jgi:hypothetical protein
MAHQWFLIKIPSKRGFNGFADEYRFVHGVLPLLWELRRDMGQWVLRLLTFDEEFETCGRRQVTTGEYFFSTQRHFC